MGVKITSPGGWTYQGNDQAAYVVGNYVEPTTFSLTYDYRCPFARNANEHVVTAIQAGAALDVHFSPFVLGSKYGAEADPQVWSHATSDPALRALAVSIVVRDRFPEKFLDVHLDLFRLRHDEGKDLRDDDVIRAVLEQDGVDATAVYTELESGWPYTVLQTEHTKALSEYQVFGVPTFIADNNAAFVRLMSRPHGDQKLAISTVDTVLSLLYDHVEINEFKHTAVPQ